MIQCLHPSNLDSAVMSRTANKKPGVKKFALPSAEEQIELKQTSIHSNEKLTALQVEGLLSETSCASVQSSIISYKNIIVKKLKKLFHQQQAPPSAQSSIWFKRLDLDQEIPDDLINSFSAPTSVHHIGSLAFETGTFPYLNLDIACVIPDAFFHHR